MKNQSELERRAESLEALHQFKQELLSLEQVEQRQLDQGVIKKRYLRFGLTPQAKAELLQELLQQKPNPKP